MGHQRIPAPCFHLGRNERKKEQKSCHYTHCPVHLLDPLTTRNIISAHLRHACPNGCTAGLCANIKTEQGEQYQGSRRWGSLQIPVAAKDNGKFSRPLHSGVALNSCIICPMFTKPQPYGEMCHPVFCVLTSNSGAHSTRRMLLSLPSLLSVSVHTHAWPSLIFLSTAAQRR